MIGTAPVAKLSPSEILKEGSPTLSGTIAQTLAHPELDRFSDDDTLFMKFHGIYQQDDRDKRKIAKQYIFMVRTRVPGGVMNSSQYLHLDGLARQYGNGTLRITSRQGFQFHGILKSGLGKTIKALNETLITTLAACGDVNRNVMAPSTPSTSLLVERVLADARRLSNALLPQTSSYHQIWVEGTTLTLEEEKQKHFVDPLYGKTYLPRKFKTAFAIPPLNDIDVFTNCLGFVAIGEGDQLHGYNLLAGGGLGMSHGNAQTYPRIADIVGFVAPEQIEAAAKAVLTIHRDFGDRENRRHARLKYVLEEKGVEWFRAELEKRLGSALEPARPAKFTKQGDLFGWHRQFDGRHFLGLYVETGRVKDVPNRQLMTALRKIAETFTFEVRLTPSQNLILASITEEQKPEIEAILAAHGVAVNNQASLIRQASMACPALPTCGLALSESERVMPDLLARLEKLLTILGLDEQEIIVRMTGCPNGCARPYMAEIGLVGRAPNKYQLYLGGNESCTRLNRLYKENVLGTSLIDELRPLFERYTCERIGRERFGDFCARVLWPEAGAKN
jgi:sulfite reductase (NADPH) hemoprotein beta-component